MNYYKVEHPKRNTYQMLLKIILVVVAITIIAITVRFEPRSEVTLRIIYQDTDVIDKTAMVSIAPGVSVYVPGTNCDEAAIQEGATNDEAE